MADNVINKPQIALSNYENNVTVLWALNNMLKVFEKLISN